jgi:large subunit ribosomal protein L40
MGDPRTDMFKRVLYPPDSVSPTSASPIGERHPQHLARIQHVLPSAEAYETTERAWALFRRRKREARELALNAKFNAMKDACDELEAVASLQKNMSLYDNAMVRVAHGAAAYRAAAQGLKQGNKKTPESRFIEARPEGMVPREQWVPTETRGKGWKYEWERPLNEW